MPLFHGHLEEFNLYGRLACTSQIRPSLVCRRPRLDHKNTKDGLKVKYFFSVHRGYLQPLIQALHGQFDFPVLE